MSVQFSHQQKWNTIIKKYSQKVKFKRSKYQMLAQLEPLKALATVVKIG